MNAIAGQLAGWGAYIVGPFIQFCISVNRLIASYFPVYFRTWNGNKLTYVRDQKYWKAHIRFRLQ